MSIRVMSAVWELELPDSEKLIALALADWSNDEGESWPSVAQIARKASKSERTVQGALKSLETRGYLKRDMKPGKGCIYTLNPRSRCTPAKSAPPQRLRKTPAAAAPNTPEHIIPQKATPSSEAQAKPIKRTDYHRLPAGWSPTLPFPARLQGKVTQWPPGELDDQLDAFRRWAANADDKPGKGRKLDWDQALHNWLDRHDADRKPPRQPNPRQPQPSAAFALYERAAARMRAGDGNADSGAWPALPG